jgi:hypothetical protein
MVHRTHPKLQNCVIQLWKAMAQHRLDIDEDGEG